MGSTTSCGCKNKENQSTFMIANDLIDGTRISAIDENRKIRISQKIYWLHRCFL